MSTRTLSRPASRTLATGIGALVVATLLAGCTAEEPEATDLVAAAQEDQYEQSLAEQKAVQRRAAELPSRPAGVMEVDGETSGSLTPALVNDYVATGAVTTVQVSDNGEDRAFQRLCAGELDVVDSARPISRAEWDACRAVGLDVVQLQVAADAVVVAIKSESDVGGDCLSTQHVQDIYRAGSPVTSWAQVGLDDVPVRVGGPDPENNAFSFFGRYVLDAPEPSLVNLRSDYRAFDSDEGSRMFVVGSDRDERLAGSFADLQRRRDELKSQLTAQWQVVADAFEEVQVASAEVDKGIRDQRPAAQRRQDQARKDEAYAAWGEARAKLRRIKAAHQEAEARAVAAAGAKRRYDGTLGHVAYFRFSYYELFEDQLRPFEITLPEGQRNCVFPSQRTIVSGEYPLARQLLLTTTTRSLDRNEVAGFLEHYLESSVEGAEEARLVALPEDQVSQQLAVVRGEQAPVLVKPADEPQDEEPSPAGPTDEPAR